MRPARRHVLRAAGAAALLGLGAACARIPTDSPIDSRPLTGQSQPGAPYVRALPPAPDATAPEVVNGFVQAGVGSEEDFAVARAYLTPEARSSWDPAAGITVYSGSQELKVEEVEEGRLLLMLQVVASVDRQGVRHLLAGPVVREAEVAIEQVEGQWRLSAVPDGIFLSEAAFESLFVPARLYFLDAREELLVPDHRWFSLRRGPTAVLEALAAGPTPFLDGAVTSRIPRISGGTELMMGTGADGTAQIAVPRAIADLPQGPRMLALSQLEASLRSMRTMAGVRLVLDEVEVNLDENTRIERALPGHRPIAAGPTGVISLADPGASAPAVQLVPALADAEVSSSVIAHGGVLAAARNPEGSVVLIASTDGSVPVREAATGGSFVPPTIDAAGYVWTSTVSSAGALLALSGQGAELDAKVDAPWLTGREVRSLAIAPDATRMLVLSDDAAGTRLDLCAVVRGSDGAPSSLTEPVVVRTSLTDMTDASWYDEIAVVVLGTDPATGDRRALIVDLAAGRDPLPTLTPGAAQIAGSVVAETVWISTEDGELLRSDGETWNAVDIEGIDPSFY